MGMQLNLFQSLHMHVTHKEVILAVVFTIVCTLYTLCCMNPKED